MKELSLEKMKEIEGGSWNCFWAGVALVGVVASIASVPVTGPIGASAAVSIASGSAGAIATGTACVDDLIGANN